MADWIDNYLWPIPGHTKITQEPGGSFSHKNANAYDISARAGSAVYAPASGTVKTVRNDPIYGNMAVVQTGNAQLLLAHLNDLSVKDGSLVRAGQLLGHSGNTGSSTGAHLHYEIRGAGASVPAGSLTSPSNPNLPKNYKTPGQIISENREAGEQLQETSREATQGIIETLVQSLQGYGLVLIGVVLVVAALIKWTGFNNIKEVIDTAIPG